MDEKRSKWRIHALNQGVCNLQFCLFLSLGQKRNCGHSAAEKLSALSHVSSRTPARSHAAGFGGKTAIIDDPTGIGWNDATANERERVGIKLSRKHFSALHPETQRNRRSEVVCPRNRRTTLLRKKALLSGLFVPEFVPPQRHHSRC